MPRIGILYGMENSFPSALVERINSQNIKGLTADHLRIGGVKVGEPSGYDVIIDRISHDIEFYRAYLKNAVLSGTAVLNNPCRWTADDKAVHYAIAQANGVPIPNTVVIPQKAHPPGTSGQSMRNLLFPLNWEEIFEYVKFPAYLKPVSGGGWMSVQRLESPEHFFAVYDQSGSTCMLLQSAIEFQAFYRAYVIGDKARVVRYDRKQAQNRRVSPTDNTDADLLDRLEGKALKLGRALGYDINAIDFAVQDDRAYVIDSFNLAPDADLHSVGQSNFEWLVASVARLATDRALGNTERVKEEPDMAEPVTASAAVG